MAFARNRDFPVIALVQHSGLLHEEPDMDNMKSARSADVSCLDFACTVNPVYVIARFADSLDALDKQWRELVDLLGSPGEELVDIFAVIVPVTHRAAFSQNVRVAALFVSLMRMDGKIRGNFGTIGHSGRDGSGDNGGHSRDTRGGGDDHGHGIDTGEGGRGGEIDGDNSSGGGVGSGGVYGLGEFGQSHRSVPEGTMGEPVEEEQPSDASAREEPEQLINPLAESDSDSIWGDRYDSIRPDDEVMSHYSGPTDLWEPEGIIVPSGDVPARKGFLGLFATNKSPATELADEYRRTSKSTSVSLRLAFI